MITRKIDGVTFMEFPHLADLNGVKHVIATRHTGSSKKPFNSLNIGFGVGDDDQHVINNRKILSRLIQSEDLVFMNQVHGTRVLAISADNSSEMYPIKLADQRDQTAISAALTGSLEPHAERRLVGDAFITDISQKFIATQVADCQSILLYDSQARVVANIHSGWRGSIKNIIGKTVRAMKNLYGCIPSDITAGIGPSLGPCCAEFINYKNEIPKKYWPYKNADDRFDFWAISLEQLRQSGVLPENICLSRICTKCNTDLFFSFRGEGKTGRFAALIGLI